ncbi:MAG TPA: glycosyltransferase family 4 protein [Jatrophihabitantaceae bacterium]
MTSALDAGGMDEVVAFLAGHLRNVDVHTAVLHATPKPLSEGTPTGRIGRLLASQGIEVLEASERAGRAWVGSWGPDVISAHGAPGWVLEMAQDLQVPYIDTLHGMHSLFGTDWAIEALRAEKLAAVVAVSETVRQQYLAGNPTFPQDRIITIPNAVDDRRRPPADRSEARARLGLTSEYVFVSLARHCLQKNSYGLVTAFGEVAESYPDAHLVIAGRPDDARYFRKVERLRRSLPSRDRIHLRDHTPAPAEMLAAADGFVLDSFFEGWSLASMEALFAGLPVVISEVGGAREQVGDDPRRGYVVPNPLGDPLAVGWQTIGAARYRDQVNRPDVVSAMRNLIAYRSSYLDGRERLAAESAVRFSPAICLAAHADVLTAVANGSAPHTKVRSLRTEK